MNKAALGLATLQMSAMHARLFRHSADADASVIPDDPFVPFIASTAEHHRTARMTAGLAVKLDAWRDSHA